MPASDSVSRARKKRPPVTCAMRCRPASSISSPPPGHGQAEAEHRHRRLRRRTRWCARAPSHRARVRRPSRIEHARGVHAVGEQDRRTRWSGGCDCRRFTASASASPSAVSRPARPTTLSSQLLAHRRQVERQRRQRVGALAEDEQADAIAAAAIEEVREHGLRGGEAIDGLAAELHVLFAHAAGQIDGEHQVAPDLRRRDRRAEFLRARGTRGTTRSTPAMRARPAPRPRNACPPPAAAIVSMRAPYGTRNAADAERARRQQPAREQRQRHREQRVRPRERGQPGGERVHRIHSR